MSRSRSFDRLSVAISALLIAGLLLAGLAMVANGRADPRKVEDNGRTAVTPPPKRSLPPTAILLPPPPPPAEAKPRRVARSPAPSAKLPALVVEPLRPVPPAPVAPALHRKPPPLSASASPATIPVPHRTEAHRAPAQPVVDAIRNRRTGGVLLRLLENGRGPTIEIAWPASASARRALFRRLTRCYGMRDAVLAGGRLFAAVGPAGQPWDLDRDRFSGFLRAPEGEAIAEEERAAEGIARRHGLSGWHPVRVFPRAVDSALLGGLAELLGPAYRTARTVRAAYRWEAGRVTLSGIRVDGHPVAGTVLLPAAPGTSCA